MRIVLLIGNSPRHYYIAKQVETTGFLAGLVVEEREAYMPEPPQDIDSHLQSLYSRHFREREATEWLFFGDNSRQMPDVPTVTVAREQLNSSKVWALVERITPDVVISYGVHKLTDESLSKFPEQRWNIHGGLSPWYRGCITHFWPSYMLEPQMTGMTMHLLTARLDGGAVLHQCAAPMVRGDGIHDVACRAVKALGEELPRMLEIHSRGQLKEPEPQKSAGKLWLARDWRPQHLRLVYDMFENRIVDAYLDGSIGQVELRLTRQF